MLDLIIFILVNAGLFAAFIVAFEYYWFVGPIAGLFGGVFTLELMRQGDELIIRTFINGSGALVYQTMTLGYFFYVPIILSVVCFSAALKRAK
jgi:hypothetical protein